MRRTKIGRRPQVLKLPYRTFMGLEAEDFRKVEDLFRDQKHTDESFKQSWRAAQAFRDGIKRKTVQTGTGYTC